MRLAMATYSFYIRMIQKKIKQTNKQVQKQKQNKYFQTT